MDLMPKKLRHIDFILASASPQRLDLLSKVGLEPDLVVPSNIDESILKNESPIEYVKRIAKLKVNFVAKNYPNSLVLAADTIVLRGKKILLKPESELEAKVFLQLLSGNWHYVYTSIAISLKNIVKCKVIKTKVRFKRLSNQELNTYLKSKEWVDKSGGYAIQGKASAFVSELRGSYDNVVGLSIFDLKRLLDSM